MKNLLLFSLVFALAVPSWGAVGVTAVGKANLTKKEARQLERAERKQARQEARLEKIAAKMEKKLEKARRENPEP